MYFIQTQATSKNQPCHLECIQATCRVSVYVDPCSEVVERARARLAEARAEGRINPQVINPSTLIECVGTVHLILSATWNGTSH
jgi:hypothetical protein